MSRGWTVLAALLVLGLAVAADAQPAPRDAETVTVTTERVPADCARLCAILCPYCVFPAGEDHPLEEAHLRGHRRAFHLKPNQFVTDRVQQIATEAGVPVQPFPCRLNVEIVFTSDPQGFLDKVRVEGRNC
jgi:hypothetical protein